MNINLSRKARKLASTLVTSLVMTAIISISLAGYLTVVQQQNFLGMRSQTWNIAIAIVEAGVEEALQHLNSNRANLATDGWAASGNVFSCTRTLPDGNRYDVSIDVGTDPNHPAIVSRAYVQPPLMTQNRPTVFFATVGQSSDVPTGISRAVRVICSKGSLFTATMVSKHSIDLKGNGVLTDSYDSSNPAKSTNGHYDASKHTGDKGDIASIGGVLDSVSLGNANIYGYVHAGPGVPVTVGSQGAVGTHAWQASNKGFQPGYVLDDANFTFPDTTLPNTAGFLTPMSGDVVEPTFNVTSTATNSSGYPNPVPFDGIATNTSYVGVAVYPNPPPLGLLTNTSYVVVANLPSPIPSGMTTNSQFAWKDDYPDPGTYVGTPQRHGIGWDYMRITGYSCPIYTYQVPLYSYNYNLHTTNVVYTTNHYDNILSANGKYTSGALSGKTLVAGPNVTLVLPNGLTGAENITFNQGAGVEVYAGGASLTISGGQYLNPNGFAGSFIVYCAPSVTSFTMNGNGQFTGVLVAPNADLVLNGGGSSEEDFCGALMVKSARFNGHFKFHYDEALGAVPSNSRFLITSWDEIP